VRACPEGLGSAIWVSTRDPGDNAGPDEVEGSGEARTHKLQLDGAAETSALALSSLEKPSVAHPARKKEDVLEVRVEAAMVIAGRLEELEGGRVRGRSPSAWSTPQRLKRLAYKACWDKGLYRQPSSPSWFRGRGWVSYRRPDQCWSREASSTCDSARVRLPSSDGDEHTKTGRRKPDDQPLVNKEESAPARLCTNRTVPRTLISPQPSRSHSAHGSG
jgi:hypothetical protein